MNSGWGLLALFSAWLGLWRLRKPLGWAAPAATFFVATGIAASFWSWNAGLEPRLATGLRYAASLSTLGLITALGCIWALLGTRWPVWAMQAVALAYTAAVLFSPEPRLAIPGIGNPSMCGSFIAITLHLFSPWLWVPLGLAVVLTGAVTPLVAALAGLAAWVCLRVKGAWKLVLVACLLGLWFLTRVDFNGRLEAWGIAWHGFLAHPWLGHGAGSAQLLVPMAQAKTSPGFFIAVHNDWLQLAYEHGAVGLLLALSLYGLVLSRAPKRLLPSLVAYGVVMLANFPLHSCPHVVLGLVLYMKATESRGI